MISSYFQTFIPFLISFAFKKKFKKRQNWFILKEETFNDKHPKIHFNLHGWSGEEAACETISLPAYFLRSRGYFPNLNGGCDPSADCAKARHPSQTVPNLQGLKRFPGERTEPTLVH